MISSSSSDGYPPRPIFKSRALLCVRNILLIVSLGYTVSAQEKEFISRPVTPESQFLELIDLENDPARQLTLMELFLVQFSKYEGVGAIYSDMQAVCVKAGKFDRALQIGDKLLAIDADDVEAVRLNLAAAEGKKDEPLAKRWKDRLAQLTPLDAAGTVTASSTVRGPYVEGADSAAAPGDLSIDGHSQSKQLRARAEAMLFNKAVAENDPATRIQILNKFVLEFPQSVHLSKVNYLYFAAFRRTGDEKRSLAIAEQILQKDQTREDVLAFVAETYFRQKRELDKVLSYSIMMLDLVNGKPKPDGVSDEEWSAQRANITLQSHWMIGTVHGYREQWVAADRELRAALALHSRSDQMSAGILTSLAWANYKLKNVADAIRFYQDCAKIQGPYQAAANQSVLSIKSEYGLAQ
jgi:tetratricopeptide (TPR) repeat protein